MQKTILIPTDFSIESLMLVKHAAVQDNSTEIEIVLMHCSLLTDSITDLLFYEPEKIIEKGAGEAFEDACHILQNRYDSKISKIRIALFHGINSSAFENFLVANHIDEAIIPENYTLECKGNSFDAVPFIRKSKIPFTEVRLENRKRINEKNTLCEMLVN